jgi:hypothetical protein
LTQTNNFQPEPKTLKFFPENLSFPNFHANKPNFATFRNALKNLFIHTKRPSILRFARIQILSFMFSRPKTFFCEKNEICGLACAPKLQRFIGIFGMPKMKPIMGSEISGFAFFGCSKFMGIVIFVCYFLKNNAVVSKYQKISNYLLLFN